MKTGLPLMLGLLMILSVTLGSAVVSTTSAESRKPAAESVRLSGNVTNLVHGRRVSRGKVTFDGTTASGERIRGEGNITVEFSADKRSAERMMIKYRTRQDNKLVTKTMQCFNKITWASAVASSFEFANQTFEVN